MWLLPPTETAAKYGIKSYGNDCDGMIKDPEVEAVVITSIDPTHHDYVMKTLAEEKWCFCEKPLSQNAKDCEEIIRREQEIGKRLVQVGFMRHYDRGYAEMKRIIASGELGKPLIIKACHRNVSQGPGFKTENGVTNVAIHELDICRWLLDDEYEDVQCVKVRQSSNSDKGYDNPQVMLMRTKKGASSMWRSRWPTASAMTSSARWSARTAPSSCPIPTPWCAAPVPPAGTA